MAGTRPKGSAKRTLLLDTAETLIVNEGYAAVSTRRVALEAGLKPPLVHYYFPTTEDLLLAVYQRAAERSHQRILEALSGPEPLEAFWALSKDSAHTALGTEFYALANHRKEIRGIGEARFTRERVGDLDGGLRIEPAPRGIACERRLGAGIGRFDKSS